ncbi:MAG: START domain-containing protein [Leptospiraceae bacterium]|nr:START domain-containing protein [Leptospiraceae bacterium]
MKKIFIYFLFILPSLLFSWDLAKNSNSIKVYTRNVEGSELKEFKATTSLKTSLSALVALLKDESAMLSWWPDSKVAKIVKETSASDWYYYFEIKAPFPVNNRDMINRFQVSQAADKKVTITLTTHPEYMPVKSGIVRLPKLKGFWQLTPQTDGNVEIIYQLHSEPGGSLPDFLANSTVTDSPHKVLTNLRKKILEEKYQSAKFDFIKE